MKKKAVFAFAIVLPVLAAVASWTTFSGSAVSGLLFPVQFIQQDLSQRYRDLYREEDRSKLVKFSHAYHKDEVGAECSQCHTTAETSTLSSDNLLAKMDQCYACHDQKTTDCKYCHVEAAEPYSAFASPKRELVFSHKQHVVNQKLKCEDCHSEIARKGHAVASVLPAMDQCMTCHNGLQAENNCRTCHTDIRFIRPDDHTSDFLLTHKQVVASSSNANCVFCHTEESCQECHTGSNLRTLKGKELIGSRSNQLGGDHTLTVESAHALDYLVTHRFDAKAKTSECQSCHEAQTFCGRCHLEGQRTMRPLWHDVAGFGGAMHGVMAKKDMENCASCHQMEGEDVVCMQCHNSNGTLKSN